MNKNACPTLPEVPVITDGRYSIVNERQNSKRRAAITTTRTDTPVAKGR